MYKDTNHNSPMAAGITGFILGVAGASAIILSDEETRKTVAKKAHMMKYNLKKWSKNTIEEVSKEKKESNKELDE